MTKVLLVEDNEMNRDMLSRRLTRRGFDVVFAVDGKPPYVHRDHSDDQATWPIAGFCDDRGRVRDDREKAH
jgi:CheY-like chemotaxis protein